MKMKTMFPAKKVHKVGFLLALCCLPLLYLLCKNHQGRHVSSVAGVKVLLMTKGRSGSSLTSDIIHARGGVFYTFEPLTLLMQRRHVEDREMDVQTKASHLALYNQEAPEMIDHYLHCRFDSLNKRDLHNFQLFNSPDSRLLWNCRHANGNRSCVENAKQQCLSRPHNLVKTIRLRVPPAIELLLQHDDLKLVYLVRDPRGTLFSQKANWRSFDWEGLRIFSTEHCQAVFDDLTEVVKLMKLHPEKAKILRYESLAETPLDVSEDLYRFLGLEYTPAVRKFVFNRTMSGAGNGVDSYGTWRGNSSQAAYSWRKKLDFSAAKTIDECCRDVYELMGYLPVRTEEELRDSSHSLRMEKAMDKLMI